MKTTQEDNSGGIDFVFSSPEQPEGCGGVWVWAKDERSAWEGLARLNYLNPDDWAVIIRLKIRYHIRNRYPIKEA